MGTAPDDVAARQDKAGRSILWGLAVLGLILVLPFVGMAYSLIVNGGAKWQPSTLETAVIEDRYEEFLRLLTAEKPDLSRECMTTKGALGTALRLERYRYAEAMLDAGCPINPDGETHLFLNMSADRKSQVRWLLAHGADPNHQPQDWNKTPAEYAESVPEMKQILEESRSL